MGSQGIPFSTGLGVSDRRCLSGIDNAAIHHLSNATISVVAVHERISFLFPELGSVRGKDEMPRIRIPMEL